GCSMAKKPPPGTALLIASGKWLPGQKSLKIPGGSTMAGLSPLPGFLPGLTEPFMSLKKSSVLKLPKLQPDTWNTINGNREKAWSWINNKGKKKYLPAIRSHKLIYNFL